MTYPRVGRMLGLDPDDIYLHDQAGLDSLVRVISSDYGARMLREHVQSFPSIVRVSAGEVLCVVDINTAFRLCKAMTAEQWAKCQDLIERKRAKDDPPPGGHPLWPWVAKDPITARTTTPALGMEEHHVLLTLARHTLKNARHIGAKAWSEGRIDRAYIDARTKKTTEILKGLEAYALAESKWIDNDPVPGNTMWMITRRGIHALAAHSEIPS